MVDTIKEVDVTLRLDPKQVAEPIIEIRSRCNGCGVRIAFDVIARRQGQDLKSWIDSVQIAAGAAHQAVSPFCSCNTADLQLPVPEGTKNVGEVVKS